jgi:hypothetical protein
MSDNTCFPLVFVGIAARESATETPRSFAMRAYSSQAPYAQVVGGVAVSAVRATNTLASQIGGGCVKHADIDMRKQRSLECDVITTIRATEQQLTLGESPGRLRALEYALVLDSLPDRRRSDR